MNSVPEMLSDHAEITELDGPPRAYFAIPELLPSGDLYVYRHVYKTLRLKSEDFVKLSNVISSELVVIRSKLVEACTGEEYGIIWWRSRPEFSHEGGVYKFRCRLDTAPTLPQAFWESLVSYHPECTDTRSID